MEHNTGTYSPSPIPNSSGRKNLRTTFVTPCRRMGLSRKSPASSGSWHANKSSPGISPYKSPLNDIHDNGINNLRTENDGIQNQVTPSRKAKTFPKRQLSKRLKTSHSILGENSEEMGIGTLRIPSQSQMNGQSTSTDLIRKESLTNENFPFSKADYQSEIVLPEKITEEMIQEISERVKKKEEILKDLKLAHLYKKKHDVGTLRKLIQTWLGGCQAALLELQSVLLTRGHQLTMEVLLGQLNIPHELVKYREDLEDFE